MRYYKNSKTNLIWVVPFIAILIACIAQPALAVSAGSLVAWGNNNIGQCNVPEGNNFTAISANGRNYLSWSWQHSLALKSDGSLIAWGTSDTNVPAGNNFTAITTGFYYSLALKSDSSLVAWGLNNDGECNVPAGNNFTAIAAGAYHGLALKSDGSMVAWGYNGDGQCNVPADNNNFTAIAAGVWHSLAMKSDGSLVAWGKNDDGQCNVPAGNNFIAIAAGDMHSLALKSDGSLVAWGNNDYNQCDVPTGHNFTAISAGGYHNLALKSDGSLVAWGNNYYGQCDVPAGHSFIAIAAGGFHNLAIANSLLVKFGSFDGQKNVKRTLKDCNSNDVTFSLSGGGYGEIDSNDCTFGQIKLYDTTEKSVFSIKTTAKKWTSIGDIIVDRSLNSISAGTTDLRGNITITGSVGKIELRNIDSDHKITIGHSSNPKAGVLMKFGDVNDLSIDSNTPIKVLMCTRWLDNDASKDYIKAPSLGTLQVKGDSKNRITGDFECDLRLDGNSVTGAVLTNATIAGKVTNHRWDISGDATTINIKGDVNNWDLYVKNKLNSLKVGEVNTCNLEANKINSLQAACWLDGVIDANSINSLKVNGDKRARVRGDFGADITLAGNGVAANKNTLGSVQITGKIIGGTWDIIGNASGIQLGSSPQGSDWRTELDDVKTLKVTGYTDVNGVKVSGELCVDWSSNTIKTLSVAGSIIDANITLSQDDPRLLALGSMTVTKWIDGSRITSAGDIGSIATGGIKNSSCFVGDIDINDVNDINSDGVLDLPNLSDVSDLGDALINIFKVNGIKGVDYSMINSNIVASMFNTVLLSYPQTVNVINSVHVPFGVAADSIKKVTIKDPNGTTSLFPSPAASGDIMIKEDLVIRVK